MPMHKWMANAAGGTSQRLKPGFAMMRSLDRNAGCEARLPAAVLVLIGVSPMNKKALQAHSTLALAPCSAQPCYWLEFETRQCAAEGPKNRRRLPLGRGTKIKLMRSFSAKLILFFSLNSFQVSTPRSAEAMHRTWTHHVSNSSRPTRGAILCG